MPRINQFPTREAYNEWYRKYRKRNREKLRLFNREYNRKYRKIYGYIHENNWKFLHQTEQKAQKATQRLIKIGKIKKLPCKICNSDQSVAHHPDYNNLFEIVWLCKIHHRQYHYRKKLEV